MMDRLKDEVQRIGKPSWRPMLAYVARLHERSTHPPRPPFPHPWEEIGPGYCYGPAFGHWDIIHAVLDVLPAEPAHARAQLLNNLAAQQKDGLVPGAIWMRDEEPRWSTDSGHPPLWPFALQEYTDLLGTDDLLKSCYEPLLRQINWFERHRHAEGPGFYYTDILNRTWESGVDEGVRFDRAQPGPFACIDATSHLYALYQAAADWAEVIGRDPTTAQERATRLRSYLQNELYDPASGFFYDAWAIQDPARQPRCFEGMWPVVVGAAAPDQAQRVIDEHLLNPDRFFTLHPICTVAHTDPSFELRMWRGPTWNSMTYWAARGCLRYRRPDAARRLVERALDASAAQFERTGTIWEFYHPHGGDPQELARKPHTPYNTPCPDYLGHNPLIAMARIYDNAPLPGSRPSKGEN
jgi:glycogen debranching enzyme